MDRNFVMKAAKGNMAEVELGQLAQQQGTSDQVKQLGQKLATDHQKANDQLKEIATKYNVTWPTEGDAKQKATKDRLSKLSGDAFDREFMRHSTQDHQHDIAEYQHEVDRGQNPDVKSYASNTMSSLREHLQMSQAYSRSGQSADRSTGTLKAKDHSTTKDHDTTTPKQ